MAKKNTDYLKVAVQAALSSGKILMASYGRLKTSEISTKSKNDFVTVIDKKSEDNILKYIRKNFPNHGIQAEESGASASRESVWIIDPLDGTSNYIHQIPMFSVSIALLDKTGLRVGVIYDPVHKELYTSERGKGAFLNGKKIRVTKTPTLSDSLVSTGIPFRARERFDEYIESLRQISLGSVGLRRGGSAALDMAYVACGRFDGFWELDLSPWDIAAGALLVEEAGGIVTDMWGRKDYLKNGDTLASNPLIHNEMKVLTSKIFSLSTKDKSYQLK